MTPFKPLARNGRKLPRHSRAVVLIGENGSMHLFHTVRACSEFLGVSLAYVSGALADDRDRRIHGYWVKDAAEAPQLQTAAI